jgi:hypothetical protein
MPALSEHCPSYLLMPGFAAIGPGPVFPTLQAAGRRDARPLPLTGRLLSVLRNYGPHLEGHDTMTSD